MVNTRSIGDFVSQNDHELRFIVSSLCTRYHISSTPDTVNDIVQDLYLKILTGGLLEKYNPVHNGNETKLSTFMYAVARNVVRSIHKGTEAKFNSLRFRPPRDFYGTPDTTDDVEIALRFHRVAQHHQEIMDRNSVSDDPDGLGAELRKFEEKYLGRINKTYKLARRKHKSVDPGKCSMLQVFRMMRKGMSNHEIAEHYGVTDMCISHIKKDIAAALKEHGIEVPSITRKRKRRRRRVKV